MSVLGDRPAFPIEASGLRIIESQRSSLIIVRAGEASLSALGQALGIEMPIQPLTSSHAGDIAVLWQGPAEWLVISPAEGADDLLAGLRRSAGPDPVALVEVGDAFQGFVLEGGETETLLSMGCRLDFHETVAPQGFATRTALAKADVILWRRESERFSVWCRRSFADYLRLWFADAARGLRAQAPG
ncbi:MAG: sarcosine oxidase subunit gamma [Geminicoccaceae bacterium]